MPALIAHRYPDGLVQQGISAELLAARWNPNRETLDEFAARSHNLAAKSASAGDFSNEIVAAGASTADETIRADSTAEKLAGLKPAFIDDQYAERFPEINWLVAPGDSSPLSDGASAALVMSEKVANRLGLRPRVRFHSFAVTR